MPVGVGSVLPKSERPDEITSAAELVTADKSEENAVSSGVSVERVKSVVRLSMAELIVSNEPVVRTEKALEISDVAEASTSVVVDESIVVERSSISL